jgi:hypothetical protein
LLGIGGFAGSIYSIVVASRIRKMNLDLADRCCYAILPILAYLAVTATAVWAAWDIEVALEVLAASFVLLLIIGMRNAWDMATFMISRDRGG